MTFVGIIERDDSIIVDGYSNRKSIAAALKDMGRFIRDNLDKGEGENIIENPEEVRISEREKREGYFLEAEEVPCASNWNEETEEMEYAAGRWYIVCRFIK